MALTRTSQLRTPGQVGQPVPQSPVPQKNVLLSATAPPPPAVTPPVQGTQNDTRNADGTWIPNPNGTIEQKYAAFMQTPEYQQKHTYTKAVQAAAAGDPRFKGMSMQDIQSWAASNAGAFGLASTTSGGPAEQSVGRQLGAAIPAAQPGGGRDPFGRPLANPSQPAPVAQVPGTNPMNPAAQLRTPLAGNTPVQNAAPNLLAAANRLDPGQMAAARAKGQTFEPAVRNAQVRQIGDGSITPQVVDNTPLTAKNITPDSVAARIAARTQMNKQKGDIEKRAADDKSIRAALSGGNSGGGTPGDGTPGGETPATGPGAGRGYPSNWNVNNSPRYAPEGDGGINTTFATDPATGATYETSPMYNWQLKEGEKNINRALRARGRSNSSFGVNQLANFYRGLGAQEEEKQYGRNWDMTLLGAQMAQAQAANAQKGGMSIADLYSTFGGQNANAAGDFGTSSMNNILQLAQLLSNNNWKLANPMSESAISRGENQAGLISGLTDPRTIQAIMDIINSAKGNKTVTV